ncbi:MAG: DNA-protecting protein DprA [Gammaproteobacteria bacterium]|nr:MAG: DNA-protecting protein DprA [Gammaproteobacteria bacterium]
MTELDGQGGPQALADWLRLLRAPGVGPATIGRLLEVIPEPGAILRATPSQLQSAGAPASLAEAIAAVDEEAVARDLAWLEAPGHHFIPRTDPRFPPRLASLPDAPVGLFVVGDPELLCYPQLAMVGSRRPTAGGRELAFDFARTLAGHGLAITSGLALGIDGQAHEGALAAPGLTLAVCGTGLDRVYPARHHGLARRIAEEGALVSEYPPGTGPHPGHFPRRNRIIAGLSLGVLVVEAARQSGSLITARLAMEYGREVFAIPGSIHNPLARGCHRLIREGAKLVESAADVLEELAGLIELPEGVAPAPETGQGGPSGPTGNSQTDTDPERLVLLEAMGFDPVSIDRIVERSGLTAEAVSSMLLIMELEGQVASLPGGRYQRLR